MCFMKLVSRPILTYSIVPCIVALLLLGFAPWTLAAAETSTVTDQKEQHGFGRFVSFKNGTLTLRGNHGILVWHNLTDKTKVVHWDHAAGEYKPSGTAEGLSKVEADAYVMVTQGKALIRVGARKERVTGTFISFKNDRLMIMGKDLPDAFTKRYGSNLHFNKFPEGLPVFESIDVGGFKLVGAAEKVLATVKEGTIVTIYGEGDDNNTRIELGVQKTK